MQAREVAKWISEEHAQVMEQMYLLRKSLAIPPETSRAAWLPDLRRCFQSLATHLNQHMELEESGGYMQEILQLRPTLTREVERLSHEHVEMRRLIEQIDSALGDLEPKDGLLIRHAIARIGMFLAYVEQHKTEEEHLVMAVFTNDIGVGD